MENICVDIYKDNVASSVQIGRNGRYVFGYVVINRGGLGSLNPPKVCSYSKPRHGFPTSCVVLALFPIR
jgi:hypothetical protein